MRSRSIIIILAAALAVSITYILKQEQKADISSQYHQLRNKQCEYQFNITDEGYEIFQHGRPVGTVPIIDSHLTTMDSLLISDNE